MLKFIIMKLHEAMIEVLKEYKRAMTGKELSDIIFERNLYQQKSGDKAPRSQIELRAKNYPQYFEYDKSETPRHISLIN